MADSWSSFAAREPYFAVLTQHRYLRANFDRDAENEFFETGEALVARIFSVIRAHVAARDALTVLEYGCGPGRLLIPFSRRATVTGVDIAPGMLETAQKHAPNAELLTVEQFDADPQRQFDIVNCYLLLQRLSPDDGLALVRRLASRVRAGGAGVFQFPWRSSSSRVVSALRTARSRVPGVNALVNVARKKEASLPFIASNVYDLNEVLAVLQEAGLESPHLELERHGDLDTVIVHAFRPAVAASREETTATPSDATFIDVKKLIAESSIEQLNRTAEEYFSSLTDWESHLAKPFARAEDTPQLLINLAVVLQGLALTPGMTVLEYGAGTGWLSRYLTQLGCKAILLDVSPTALKIARELCARQPVIGERPEPQFLQYDGHRIDLPDASVDRILCFDSFHHATNPDEVLWEFGRVLKPRGIAGFAEPGPEHSKTPQSQYEMRTYGVVENDIDLHAIWQTAERVGFAELRVAAFNVPPFWMSLAELDQFLNGTGPYARWGEQSRRFLTGVRDFFLLKPGAHELDSRRTEGLSGSIEATLIDPSSIRVTVRNTGRARWLSSKETYGGVAVGAHFYDASGHLLQLDPRQELPRELEPEQEATVVFELPKLEPGTYTVEIDLVANKVAWFAQIGSTPARVTLSS